MAADPRNHAGEHIITIDEVMLERGRDVDRHQQDTAPAEQLVRTLAAF